MSEQLDLFHQAPDDPPAQKPAPEPEPRRTQMTELPGETWEEAFGNAA